MVSCGALRFGIHREGGGTGCWNEPTTHTGVAAFPSPPGTPSTTTLFYSIIRIEHRVASKVVFFKARRSPTVASRRKE